MKFQPVHVDGVDLLILVIAAGTLLLVSVLLTVADVERFISSNEDAGGGDLVNTLRSDSFNLRRELNFDLSELSSKETAAGENADGLRKSGVAGIRLLISTRDTRDVILHDGMIYLATDGGLVVYRPGGELIGHYTHLNGLPSNRLRCLASWRESLWIGCDKGLVRLQNNMVTTYSSDTAGAESITALLPAGDRLLVGTDGAGLLSFDGEKFQRDLGRVPGADFKRITALAEWREQIIVGSFDNGLFVGRGTSFVHLGKKDGLPDERVTGLAPGEDLLAATLTGICSIDERLQVHPWERGVMAASVLRTAGATLVATLDGRLESYSAGRRRSVIPLGNRTRPVTINRLASADNRTWLLTGSGAMVVTPDGLEPFGEKQPGELYANFVAALDFDASGKLWIGYFDEGIELFSPDMVSVGRIDDDACRTVKCLYYDGREGVVYVGSSKGLTGFRGDGSRTSWTTDTGLISNEVNYVKRWGEEIVAATGGGLSFIRGREVRSIYAFHGLINNKVFSLLPLGKRLIAGTLGGINIIEDHRVTGSITPENSQLPVHWITALWDLDGALLIGTYGGGLALRRAAGVWEELPRQVRNLEVNPNAVLALGDTLLVGTLDRGLVVYRAGEGRWRLWSRGLSSPNVTALAADERRVFIGTDNGIIIINKAVLV
jgi:ligand-binding sensor domain-containing protein